MRKISFKYLLPALGVAGVTAGLGATIPSLGHSPAQQSASLGIKKQDATVFNSDLGGASIGKVRQWGNTNFSGSALQDGGYALLTDTASATRVDAYGNALWTFDPTTFGASVTGKYGTIDTSTWANKKVVEIVQDQAQPSTFYLLLVPKAAPDASVDGVGDYNTPAVTTSTTSPANLGTVVQVTESLNNFSDAGKWNIGYTVDNATDIKPSDMTKNYPSEWTDGTASSTFFRSTTHPNWYAGGTAISMPWQEYITNLGHMYAQNGTVLMFGGNGTIFDDPDALSIGMFRIKFGQTNTVDGIPYAYLLSGMHWDPIAQTLNAGTATTPGIYVDPNYSGSAQQTYAYPISYTSRLPLGQSSNYSYVPRMAVAGVMPNFGDGTSSDSYLYVAGTITVGQSQTSQGDTGGDAARSVQPSGENAVPNLPLTATPTSENSIDPLTTFGTAFDIGTLLNLPSSTSGDNASAFTQAMSNGMYYDTAQFAGYQDTGIYEAGLGTTISSDHPNADTLNADSEDAVTSGVNMPNSLVYGEARSVLLPTINAGYSLKSAGGLVQFGYVQGSETTYGYAFQLGGATIAFAAPKFDVASLVYRQPAMWTLPDDMFNAYNGADQYDYTNGRGQIATNADGTSLFGTGNNKVTMVNHQIDTIGAENRKNIATNVNVATISSHWTGDTSTTDPGVPAWSSFHGLSTIASSGGTSTAYVGSLWSANGQSNYELATPFLSTFPVPGLYSSVNSSSLTLVQDPEVKNLRFRINDSLNAQSPGIHFGFLNNNLGADLSVTGSGYGAGSTDNFGISDSSDYALQGIIPAAANTTSDFAMGQLSNGQLVRLTISGGALDYKDGVIANSVSDRIAQLGYGTFLNPISSDVLQKSISTILQSYDAPGLGNVTVVSPEYLNGIFQESQAPAYKGTDFRPVILVASDVNLAAQSAKFTAYSYNQNTGSYDLTPASQSSLDSISTATFTGFNALAPWVLPVAICVPIIVIALAIGLGCGIGIPMQKNKKALQMGFEIQNKKVDTLTTAVGSVFKSIIDRTNLNAIKRQPQMLNAGSRPGAAPARPGAPTAPGAAPARPAAPAGAPRPVSSPTTAVKPAAPAKPTAAPAKPAAPAAPAKPAAPAAPKKPA